MRRYANSLRKNSVYTQYIIGILHNDVEVNMAAGCSKRPFSKATGESKPEAYPSGYVEDFDESRTPLADFFSILLESDADFIQVSEQVGRILIDPIGSRPLQLLTAIAPGKQSHREGKRPTRGQ